MKKNKVLLFLLNIFIIVALFSGIISYLSFFNDNIYIKLWKEIFIGLLFIIAILIYLPKIHIKTLKISVLILLFAMFYFLYNDNNIPKYLTFYQYKIDFSVFIMFLLCFLIFSFYANYGIQKYMLNLTKIILLCAIINALFIIYQHFFISNFLNMIDLNYGNWGTSNGVKVITANNNIRAIGFLSNFVSSGEFMLFSIILLIENKKYTKINNILYILLLLVLMSALVFTTLKSAILGLIIYLFVKFVESIFKSKNYKKLFIILFSSIIFIFQAIAANSLLIYNVINKVSPNIAYNSIYLRIIQHNYIFNNLKNIHQFLFGLGYGLNGTYGIDKSLYGINAIALDSTYIYLLSNVGFIGVALYVIFMFYILIKLYNNPKIHCFGIQYFIIYLINVEFFYNNIITNFPVNLIVIVYICYSSIEIRRGMSININECMRKKLRVIWR